MGFCKLQVPKSLDKNSFTLHCWFGLSNQPIDSIRNCRSDFFAAVVPFAPKTI